MEKLLKQIVETMAREQVGFSDVEQIVKYGDGTVRIVHLSENPKRKIEVELPTIDSAISYVNSF